MCQDSPLPQTRISRLQQGNSPPLSSPYGHQPGDAVSPRNGRQIFNSMKSHKVQYAAPSRVVVLNHDPLLRGILKPK